MSKYPNLLVALGASAGGFREIVKIVEQLPESFQGTLVIATHRTPHAPNVMADVLAHYGRIRVAEPADESAIDCSTIYIGKPSERVEVEDDGSFAVEVEVSNHARIHRIDDLFRSVAQLAGKNAVGVVLSGMLWDGVAGLNAIHELGGKCIVQDPMDASFASMPTNALAAVPIAYVGTADEIAQHLVELAP